MAQIPEIIPVTDLRQDAAAVLKRLQTSQGPPWESTPFLCPVWPTSSVSEGRGRLSDKLYPRCAEWILGLRRS